MFDAQAIEQVSNIPIKTSLVVEKTHTFFQTNIHPPQVGLFVPQGFLPFSLYAAWVKEARAVWVNIIDSHCKNIMLRSIKKAIVLIVFRTQNPYFDPINYDAKVIINIQAYAFSYADMASAKINQFIQVLDKSTGTDDSQWVWAQPLERNIYCRATQI